MQDVTACAVFNHGNIFPQKRSQFFVFCFFLIMKAASHLIFPFPDHYVLFQIVWHGMTAVPKFYIGRDWWDVQHLAVEKFWCPTTSSKFFGTSLSWLACDLWQQSNFSAVRRVLLWLQKTLTQSSTVIHLFGSNLSPKEF